MWNSELKTPVREGRKTDEKRGGIKHSVTNNMFYLFLDSGPCGRFVVLGSLSDVIIQRRR